MEQVKNLISQNMKILVQELGEKSCIFYLNAYFNQFGWNATPNYNDSGYDVLFLNEKTNKNIHIEVKTRQTILSIQERDELHRLKFMLSENEKNNAQFLVACIFNRHEFFIVPITELTENISPNNKKTYTYTVTFKNNEMDKNSKKYLNNWNSLINGGI